MYDVVGALECFRIYPEQWPLQGIVQQKGTPVVRVSFKNVVLDIILLLYCVFILYSA